MFAHFYCYFHMTSMYILRTDDRPTNDLLMLMHLFAARALSSLLSLILVTEFTKQYYRKLFV